MTLNPYHLAAGVIFLGAGTVLLGILIVLRDRLARTSRPPTPAQRSAEGFLTMGGIACMLVGLGAIALGVA